MLGVVLCGGMSSRMGTDKGLLKSTVGSWAEMAVDKILKSGLSVVVSVREDQHDAYAKFFPVSMLIRDSESLQLKGPLHGVLSIHQQFPDEDLFVLACDLPLIDSSIIKEIIESYSNNKDFDAWLFTNNGEVEPLCGVYSAAGLSTILKMYNEGRLTKHSMKFMIERLNNFFKPIPDANKKYFKNFNSHKELNELE